MRLSERELAPRALAILALAFLALDQLPLSTVVAGQGEGSSNWTGVDGNYPQNWNYSPQQAINSGNVNALQAAWTFPVPAAVANYTGAEGVMVTPLVVDGVAYLVANWHRIFALDAAKGSVIWYRDLPLLKNYTMYVQPSIPGPNGIPLGHYHQMIYTTGIMGRPLIWLVSNTYQVFALDANNGQVVVSFSPLALDWPGLVGNHGLYDVDTPTILVDQARGVVMFGPSVSEGQSSGRGYLEAWDVRTSTPRFLWRDYVIPPQDGSQPGWSLSSVENMTYASVFDGSGAVDLKALTAAELRSMLYNDWSSFGFKNGRSYAGAGVGWGGSWAIDEASGIAYVSTSTATPDWNATERPGLDLWSDSVLAVNVTSGRMIWGFQAIPHPLGDFDCSWNVILANATRGGQVVPVIYKGCKNGYVFALDARTGSMLWFLRPSSIRWDNVGVLDPRNATEMTRYNWNGYPKTGKVVQNPSDTGALESDLAYDPTNGMVFAAVYNSPKLFQYRDVGAGRGPFNLTDWEYNWGVNVYSITQESPVNMTVIGIDGGSGAVKWAFPVDGIPFRGGLTVTGGVVFVPCLDGVLRMVNEADGTLLGQRLIGGELINQPAVAQDRMGNELLILTDMGSSRWGPVFPGFVQALAAPAPAPSTGEALVAYAVVAVAVAFLVVVFVAAKLGLRRVVARGS